MKKIKYVIGIVILVVISYITIVYADYLYESKDVEYNNSNSTLNSTSVQGAIDELYEKVNEMSNAVNLPKVTYDANGGTFDNNKIQNIVSYVPNKETIVRISKSSNLDESGNRRTSPSYAGYMPKADYGGIIDTIKIDEAKNLIVNVTYQSNSSSLGYVALYDKSINPSTNNINSSISGMLGGTTLSTQTYIIDGNTARFLYYNSMDQNSNYNDYYGYYATIEAIVDKKISIDSNYIIPTKSNVLFYSWNTKADGSGNSYFSESDIDITNGEDITLYAQYKPPICKRASSLHTEICTNNSSASYYCRGAGHALNGEITYGNQSITDGELHSGDAFDCDVNGDGVYDALTERFYYISDYGDYDSDYAVLIYYTNTNGSDLSSAYTTAWSSGSNGSSPNAAITKLPITGTNAWRSDLLKTTTRNILDINENTTQKNFSYEGIAARLLTYQEIYAGCYDGSHSITRNDYGGYGLQYKCEYLFENTDYSNSSNYQGYWLESPYSSSNAYRVTSQGRCILSTQRQ